MSNTARTPVRHEITSGEVFRVEDPGKEGLRHTRMERDAEGYYSVHGYHLHDGLRAAIGPE